MNPGSKRREKKEDGVRWKEEGGEGERKERRREEWRWETWMSLWKGEKKKK